MSDPLTVGELREFLDGVDEDRDVFFIGSGAIHDCVGARAEDVEWNIGTTQPAVVLGGHGSGVDDPRETDD
ncbi:hypothetical protein OSG_eHP14_00155 [environmental Halophage eHP-14]|nr:hypothetical protein OSG_eHP14_00155 [environmental Halophage eHP-14]